MTFDQFREDERAGWSERASIYDDATARATSQSIPALLSHLAITPDARLLDAGCGPGYLAAIADILGAQAEGIDFSADMVARAKAKFPHIPFAVGDVENLDAADDTYDCLVANMVLFHVTDPAKAVSEARRVLKPGGRFAFSQWLGPEQSVCYRLLFSVVQKHADMSLADPAPNAYALSDPAGVEMLLNDAGFGNFRSEIVENVLHAPGPSFHDFFMRFGVRVPLILQKQTEAVQKTVRKEIDELAAAYRTGDGYAIPMPSVIYSAVAE